ncbi:MAG: Smr/MutS family protein [Paracoccus sp. (in: a-proteobacteria)]|uniref:Smr/MutS family protein n=1 Tax=Paracoccus sp. TaxID=267 RepID=UPI0026DF26C3|nr:Smr/MutS family protein [Paracoccus sp. (in: a-proteobacteria)]MDO5621013.1 Smr/MutS family protein [Paracoccus sp. (in: a-proteobacteria)]
MSRRRGLTDEDRALWSQVARSAVPLHPARPALPKVPPKPAPLPRRDPPQSQALPQFRIGQGAGPAHGHDLAPEIAAGLAAQPLRMDHKTHRRMNQGKLRPEARIDLHGMTLAMAQPELLRFVIGSHAMGRRLVLVITGKGKPRDDGGPIPVRLGILRHQVPVWLHQPPLAGLVLQVTPAHQRHGGNGAYYVYLRR